MAGELSGKRIAFLVAQEGVEEVELRTDERATKFLEQIFSSRKPDDLPAFCGKLVEEFAEGRHGVGAMP